MSTPGWEYGQPVASGGRSSSEGLRQIYGQVGQHMGLAIFLPMVSTLGFESKALSDHSSLVCWTSDSEVSVSRNVH